MNNKQFFEILFPAVKIVQHLQIMEECFQSAFIISVWIITRDGTRSLILRESADYHLTLSSVCMD